MRKKKLIQLMAIVFVIIGLSILPLSRIHAQEPVRIAVITDLSGPYAAI